MEIIFLGTGSAYPSPHRAASGAILRNLLTGSQWLFDCGEGTQIQAQKCNAVKVRRISQIFISHLHGDHIYGLPGLLSTIGQRSQNAEHSDDRVDLEIYGPQGLRRYLRLCLAISRSLLNFTYTVHELIFNADQKPEGPGGQDWVSMETHATYDPILPFERPGRDIHPDADGFWRSIFDSTVPTCPLRDSSANISVHAVALKHTVASLGWLIFEPSGVRRLSVEKACALGVPRGPMLGSLKKGNSVTFLNDGQEVTVSPNQVLLAPKKGRRIAILGDSCESSELTRLLKCDFLEPISLDFLVHEATMHSSYGSDVFKKGHSTALGAAQFAATVGARHLVLTHFSQRYVSSVSKCAEEAISDSKDEKLTEDVSVLLEDALSCKEFTGIVELAEDLKLIKIDP